MTESYAVWPAPETETYAALAAKYRPLFTRIAEGAAARDRDRTLAHDPIRWLKEAGYTATLLPVAEGGDGTSIRELIALQTELAAADSNVTQALRAHFGQVIGLLSLPPGNAWRARWLASVAKGEISASGLTETGVGSVDSMATTLRPDGDGHLVEGRKFYTTGGLYAEWIATMATDPSGRQVRVMVPTDAPGLSVVDDWDGWGQKLTASGSAIYTNVRVAADQITPPEAGGAALIVAYAQISHLATLSGIGRGAVEAVLAYTRARTRTFSHGSGATAASDPLVQQKLGQVIGRVASANALTLHAAGVLERGQARLQAEGQLPVEAAAQIDLAVYQAQIVVQEQVLTAVTTVFDALGASALSAKLGLDRFWRNARAISSHNPVIYKERILGDHALNGTLPPGFWVAGTAKEGPRS